MAAFTTRHQGPSPSPADGEEPLHHRATVPAHPSWAATVRRTVTEHLAGLRLPPEQVDNAVLMADELFVNAVRHASHGPTDTVTVIIDCTEHALRVTVADSSPALPQSPAVVDETAESGRGLTIVTALADDWGVAAPEPGNPGKRVWFTLGRPGVSL
ncbi:ATP-binding protein [Streptomyces sp. NPDC057877]|uniref:ATP-binding protein n=1 Tax=Streptomyces sp. NPDC057877 TaxID=3346269 RepID=UPI00368391CA